MSRDLTRGRTELSAWMATTLITMLMLFATGALAAPRKAIRQACAADVKALCSGVQQGGGRVMACMRENADKLSPGCQQALQSAKSARQSGSGS